MATLETRVKGFITAVGADIKALTASLSQKAAAAHTHTLSEIDDVPDTNFAYLKVVPSTTPIGDLDPDGTAKNLTLWAGIASAIAAAVADLGEGVTASGTSHTITPTGSRSTDSDGVVLNLFVSVASGQTAPTIASISGRGLTWTLRTPTSGDPSISSNNMVRQYTYVGTGTDTGGNITVTTTGGTTTGAAKVGWRLSDLIGINVVPAEYRTATTVTGSAIALSMTPAASNIFVGAMWVNSSSDNPTPNPENTDFGPDVSTTAPSQTVAGSTKVGVQADAGWTVTGTNQVKFCCGLSFTPKAA